MQWDLDSHPSYSWMRDVGQSPVLSESRLVFVKSGRHRMTATNVPVPDCLWTWASQGNSVLAL